jgi:hypothetical protein
MDATGLNAKVGDRVVISRPNPTHRFAANVERFAAVTAVRPKSFDAGGLCFRNDGREWGGHNRARLIPQLKDGDDVDLLPGVEPMNRLERASEDALLAFLLSSRHEKEWLKLGIHELRRIAALHGIGSPKPDQLGSLSISAYE